MYCFTWLNISPIDFDIIVSVLSLMFMESAKYMEQSVHDVSSIQLSNIHLQSLLADAYIHTNFRTVSALTHAKKHTMLKEFLS